MPLMGKKWTDRVQSKILDRKFWALIDGAMINESVASDNDRYEEDIPSTIADKDGIETETLLRQLTLLIMPDEC